jgi:crooked neck
MEWEPDEQAWQTYINFELRYKEIDRARHIYERFVMIHPEVKHWIKYARYSASYKLYEFNQPCLLRFEEQHAFINSSRNVYQRAVEFFGDEDMDERLYIGFARFEENQREVI